MRYIENIEYIINILEEYKEKNILTIISLENVLFQQRPTGWINGDDETTKHEFVDFLFDYIRDSGIDVAFIYNESLDDYISDYIITKEIDENVMSIVTDDSSDLKRKISDFMLSNKNLEFFNYVDCNRLNLFMVENIFSNTNCFYCESMDTVNNTFGDYHKITKLSRGSYGNVYSARKGNKDIILKEYLNYRNFNEPYDAIVEFTSSVKFSNSKHITKYKKLFVVGENKEFLLGEIEYHFCDLLTYIKTVSIEKRLIHTHNLFNHLLKGLYDIHSNGYIHRDIKVNNILVDINNNVVSFYYADFGGMYPVYTYRESEMSCKPGGPKIYLPDAIQEQYESRDYYTPEFLRRIDVYNLGIVFLLFISEYNKFDIKHLLKTLDNRNYHHNIIINMVSNNPPSIYELLNHMEINTKPLKSVRHHVNIIQYDIKKYFSMINWIISVLKEQQQPIFVFLISWNILNRCYSTYKVYNEIEMKKSKLLEYSTSIVNISTSLNCNMDNYISTKNLSIISGGIVARDIVDTSVKILDSLAYDVINPNVMIFRDYFRSYDQIRNFFKVCRKQKVRLSHFSYDYILENFK